MQCIIDLLWIKHVSDTTVQQCSLLYRICLGTIYFTSARWCLFSVCWTIINTCFMIKAISLPTKLSRRCNCLDEVRYKSINISSPSVEKPILINRGWLFWYLLIIIYLVVHFLMSVISKIVYFHKLTGIVNVFRPTSFMDYILIIYIYIIYVNS